MRRGFAWFIRRTKTNNRFTRNNCWFFRFWCFRNYLVKTLWIPIIFKLSLKWIGRGRVPPRYFKAANNLAIGRLNICNYLTSLAKLFPTHMACWYFHMNWQAHFCAKFGSQAQNQLVEAWCVEAPEMVGILMKWKFLSFLFKKNTFLTALNHSQLDIFSQI